MKTFAGRWLGIMALCAACWNFTPAPLSAAESSPADVRIPRGKGDVTIHVDAHTFKVFTYRPKNYSADQGPLLVVFHGHSRNPDAYRDHAVELGDACGGLVVAPFFDEQQFPDRAYNHGNVFVQGVLQPKEKWTFSLVPKLIEKIRASEGRPEMPYYLLGHSGGGQFVERLMALTELKPIRAVAANPGSHLFADRGLDFPYGFGGLPKSLSNDAALKAYLAAPLTLYLGTADTDPQDPQLDRSKTALKQGPHRLARGHRCYDLAKELATAKGWDFNWRLLEAPGVGHSAGKMFAQPACRAALFGKSTAK